MSEPNTHQAPLAQPVCFGAEDQQLFGWFHAPAIVEGAARDCVVVMCNPIGYDAICTHRHYRVLAQKLADAGFSVLRYDHHGTGDSAGNDEDPERVNTWVEGVRIAVEFAQKISGIGTVSLFGVRMGGTIALAAASRREIAQSLVAWAAFPSGSNYLREMRALRMARDLDASAPPVSHDAGADLGEEAAGYLLTASTIAELESLNLLSADARVASDALILLRDDIPQSEKLATHLAKAGCQIDCRKVPGYAGMMLDTFDAVVPEEALSQIKTWLVERHRLKSRDSVGKALPVARLVAGIRGAESDVADSAVRFGVANQFFGVLSEPIRSQGARRQTAVIFVSVGSNLHVGPNRMYVSQARALASLGFLALRMDIGGVGESPPSEGHRENHLYAMHSVADVRAAVSYLRQTQGVKTIILVGVCSGAYLSYHAAAVDSDVCSVVLINPQTFSWRDGDSLELKARTTIKAMSFYRSRMFNWETWKRLLSGQINIGIIAAGVFASLQKRWRIRLERAISRQDHATDETTTDVKASFEKMMLRGANVFLLYSSNDGGLNELEAQLGENATALKKHSRFKFQIVEGADHTFTPLWAQRRLLDLLSQHLLRLYG